MTNIITSLAIVIMAVAIVMLVFKHHGIEEEVAQLEELVDKKASVIDLQTVKNRLTQEIAEGSQSMLEINEITARLNEIAEDIARLDEKTAQDHKDLVDIRERYILWREPTPTGGVPWATEFVCGDDNEQNS